MTDFIMGMPVVIDIPGLKNDQVIEKAFDNLRRIDEQFSPFKPDSELMRFRRKEVPADKVSIGMKNVMKACLEAERYTNGYFSARYGGEFDPSGYVKGWAIAEAKLLLFELGYRTFSISAGGDITTRSSGEKVWRIGVQHPKKKNALMGKIFGKNMGIATSGNYEKGTHIINPHTGKGAQELLSLTVVGPDIVKADVLATAAFAMGLSGLQFIDKQLDYEVLAVDKTGRIYLSGGMANMLEGELSITGEVI